MNGLELSRAFFEEYGRPMLETQFGEWMPYLAAGLFGSGSECFGFDDDVSRDHDFEPGFCIFLPEESVVDRRTAFLMERAYSKLPRTFMGLSRPVLQPVGGARHGFFRTTEFFRKLIGSPHGMLDLREWLSLPEQSLAEATNGELYFDSLGEVTRIRDALRYFPEDVRCKKLAGQLLLMEQAGQYNYERCIAHGETGAAQLAIGEFVSSAMSAVFLLNRQYQPYYKWRFRAFRHLKKLSELADPFEQLLTTGNDPDRAAWKACQIEAVCSAVRSELALQGLSNAEGDDLERHAYAVNDLIENSELRNLHILAAI